MPSPAELELIRKAADSDAIMSRSRSGTHLALGGGGLLAVLAAIVGAFEAYRADLSADVEQEIRGQLAVEKAVQDVQSNAVELNAFKQHVSTLKASADQDHKRIEEKIDLVIELIKQRGKHAR